MSGSYARSTMSRFCLVLLAALLACARALEDNLVAPGIVVTEGETATLLCLLSGNPPPVINWNFRKHTNIIRKGRYKLMSDDTLEISPTYLSDAGVYICVADFIFGRITQEIHLIVNVQEQACTSLREDCERACKYGVHTPIQDRCHRCECREDPCLRVNCSASEHCEPVELSSPNSQGDLYAARCLKSGDCKLEIKKCARLNHICRFGIVKIRNTDGCERCKCNQDPCKKTSCPAGKRCVVKKTMASEVPKKQTGVSDPLTYFAVCETASSTTEGVSETTENTTGASELSEVETSTSYTTNEGLENEGCSRPGSTSPHGCCQDGKTPAHGPDFEGCCLLQVFGCCPDNRKPAEGPHFEGCGCQYALHGCCPDNVTIAQGSDNQGCGCQYTEYGCCPDRHTAAPGPNNEGCACNTYQFGCCADGVTTAKGPEQQGCHCRDSKFKCCGDGETPATGPDGAGCDCSSSRHGCCPDGRSEATGPKFLGCTDAPENKQAACSMPTDPGPCHNFAAMWYYDQTYGGCSRFWYGGCDGNGNRFSTKEECVDVCVQPSPKDACKLPSVKGACDDADYQRWHYNSTQEQCMPFRYGGCLGNANNFDTRELCQKQCGPSSVAGQCKLPIEQGSCAGNYSRWGFNSEAHRCEQFIWGGCEGNSNRFSTEAACQMRCGGTQPFQCTQPQEAGNCMEKEALWSFSQLENRCLPFYYTGCGGNDNRFSSKEACEQTCPSAYGLENEGCSRPGSTSPHGCCQDGKTPAHGPDFEGCCLLQVFGCCPDNRKPAVGPHFEGCGCKYALHGCCPDNVTIAQGPDNQGCGCQYTEYGCCPDRHTAASGPNNEGCACNTYQFGCCADGVTTAKGPEQQGCHCRDSKFKCCGDGETPATGPDGAGCDCSSSRHGCCPDGRSEATGPKFLGCTDAPENKQAACSMPTDPGPCHNFAAMWYYDQTFGGCSRFFYGGCGGNGNRFSTKEECVDVCVQPSPKDACKLPSVKGACDADYQRWQYNSTQEQCIPFRYGGCFGNANNFDTRELCQKQCGPSSVAGQCKLPIEQGSCAGNYSRWGFNSEAHRCEQFIWGGCEGNSNRFSTEAACQMRCGGTQPFQCTQPQEAGNCMEKEALWSFSQSENRCLPFYYTGCGGNDNRFSSKEACEQTCPSAYASSTTEGVSERTENTTGASELSEVETSTSYTTNEGLENEGCSRPGSTSPHGCCQDGKTPAHGPDFEGCCLLQVFGCCPDNRKPAEVPHFEGCGCQYALHGCCPDNVTIAEGSDNQGCGCQYTEYGCCPDRHTAASGPNNEGCACNTYQFGCCADGVTTAKGPEQQGCHCRDSKFKCCGDGETPATGPDGAGCDCSSSRHGCCPDGRSEATGPKFLGCTDAPENKQAACSMPTDPGPCHNFAAMWYYDQTFGGCSRFFYGGCGGNGNRFSTKEECVDVCVQPSPKDACKLPSVKGACDADYQRWHYNSTQEQCIPFRYGGCLGNANNFDTRELCQKQCGPSSVAGQCKLPIEQGSCAGNYSRWGFNSEAHRCEQFIWGGCEGNSNRFSTEAACQMRCGGTQPFQCTQPQEAGNCMEKEALWSFSQSENRCLPFYYSGCGGNDNRFSSKEACEQTCPSAYELMVPAKCTDDPFVNCNLIVLGKICRHSYYSKFCCKSCVEAGQLDPQEAELQADQPYRKK